MSTFTNQTKNTETFVNEDKNVVVVSNTPKTEEEEEE